MRILYIDIDSLRPDHLGCYGYHRNTSPNIDRIAARGTRCNNYYASDVPCLPSRTAIFTGRLGIHTGVINHGGLEADIRPQGIHRQFANRSAYRSWIQSLRQAGLHTVMISPFATRHAAWQVLDGFAEVHDPGKNGNDRADEVWPHVEKWMTANAQKDNWFLHVNFWDPHTPYRTPLEYGNPFEDDPAPDWPSEEEIRRQRSSFAPHGTRELAGWGPCDPEKWPRVPEEIRDRHDFKKWIDGYDVGVHYADHYVGKIVDALEAAGVLDETVLIVSADHGENQGELGVFGDHQTADYITCRVPLIAAGPGIAEGHVDNGFHYQVDLAPTTTELVGGQPAPRWDGRSFLPALTQSQDVGRQYLVLSQGAWACQRAVRWDNWMLIRSYHDGLKDCPEVLLFDIDKDPHETTDLAEAMPDVTNQGLALLERWVADQMFCSDSATDPLWHVIREGGPFHTREKLDWYLERLRESGRHEAADRLEARHRKHQ